MNRWLIISLLLVAAVGCDSDSLTSSKKAKPASELILGLWGKEIPDTGYKHWEIAYEFDDNGAVKIDGDAYGGNPVSEYKYKGTYTIDKDSLRIQYLVPGMGITKLTYHYEFVEEDLLQLQWIYYGDKGYMDLYEQSHKRYPYQD